MGREIVGKIVALGALSEITHIISYKSLELALLDRVPKGTEDINKKALRLGRRVARKIMREMEEIEIEDYTIDESSL